MADENENSTQVLAVFLTQEPYNFAGEVMAVIRQSIAIFAALLNGAILVAFLVQKCRRSTVQVSPAGVLVLNLLFADAFVGAVIFRLSTHITLRPEWCLVTLGFGYLATIGSHIAVLNVVVDRFVAVTYTLQYRDYMTLTRSAVMVCCGWSIPVAGLAAAFLLTDWGQGPVARCTEIRAFRSFLEYVGVPSHVIANLCVVVLQCRLYLTLRRHDAEKATSNQVLRMSTKAAWILYRITTPTYVAMLCYDVVLIVVALWINKVVKSFHDVILLFVQLSYLMNPLVYAYATVNVRKPVTDLCTDIVKWFAPPKESPDGTASTRPMSRTVSVNTTTI